MNSATISLKQSNSELLLVLTGSTRVETAEELYEHLLQAQPAQDLGVDWSGAEYVHACVLQVLLAYGKTLGHSGHSIRVNNDNEHVRDFLQVSGLSDYFPLRQQAPASQNETANG